VSLAFRKDEPSRLVLAESVAAHLPTAM